MGHVELIARSGIALVFASAAISKLRDRASFRAFRYSLERLSLPGPLKGSAAAGLVASSEAVVPVLLAFAPTTVAGYALGIILLCAFSVAIGRAVARGDTVSCRCFGADGAVLSATHLARNGILIALCVIGEIGIATTRVGASAGAAAVALASGAVIGLLLTRWDDLAFLATVPPESSRQLRKD